ncbi:MAG TPA: cyclic nucleotide-binding domain-containing protein [Gaiellaceae bacterium]|nr:cyclic nucleotide-binding domain-containing protein [Gaiellaceae bacterium]
MRSVADPGLGRLGALKRLNTRPPVRRILTAWAACFAGEAIAAVAFGVLAYRSAGATGVAFLVAVQLVPTAILAPLLVTVAEDVRRERLAFAVDVARAAVAAVAAAASEAGAPREVLFALAAVLTVGTAVSNPLRRGLLPLLVEEPSELTAAGVVIGVVQAIAQTAGPLLAAVLFSVGGSWEVLVASAACFAVAALTEAGLPNTSEIAARPTAREAARITSALHALAGGFRAMRSDSELAVVTGMFAAKNLGRGALNVLIVVIPLALLGLGSAGVGWLTAVLGGGGVAGGILATALVGRRRLIPAMSVGLALWGLPLIVLGGWPYLAVAVIGLAVLGAGNTITDVAGYTLIGRSARDDLIAAVYSVHEAVRAGAIVVGSAATAAIVELWGTRQALIVAGIGLAVAAAAAMLLRSREHAREIRPEYMELIRANPLFRWLPPIAVARLSSRLETVELDEGDVLLREGDPGDCAYLLERGELVADKGGLEIGRVRPGGVVGEIALLHDAPRMATVRAVTGCRLLMIERDEFLAAATGNTGARDEAVQLVDRRLAEAAAATRV